MKRRLALAVALSVGVHGAAVAVVPAPKPVPLKTPELPAPVELEVVEVEPPASDPAPTPAPVPPKAVVKKAKPQEKKSQQFPELSREAVAPEAPLDSARGTDSPQTPTLVPRDAVVKLPDPEQPQGFTVHNRPEELPDPAALLAFEADTVKHRVDGWTQRALAQRRVQVGVFSPYFTDLRHQMERVSSEPPPFIEPLSIDTLPEHGRQVVRDWKVGAERYGKTGQAFERAPSYADLHGVLLDDKDKAVQAHQFATTVEMGAYLRDFGDGKMGEELVAIVELKQGTDGALADLSLIAPSSSVRFDTWVMAQAPKALDGLASPPDAGVGIHADGLRTVWAFKGRVSYKRELKDAKLLEDGWYVGLMLVPGLLTGNFDEVTGKVEYVDLRYPHYECRVQLLEVY